MLPPPPELPLLMLLPDEERVGCEVLPRFIVDLDDGVADLGVALLPTAPPDERPLDPWPKFPRCALPAG